MLRLLRCFTAIVLVSNIIVVAAGAGAVEPADDSTKNAARELAQRGKEAHERGDWAAAGDFYGRAYALVPAPTLALREARALAQGGLWVQAVEAYVRATHAPLDAESPEAFRHAVEDANRELAELRPRIPQLKLVIRRTAGTEVSVAMDGQPYPAALWGVERPVNPGRHQIVASTPQGPETKATIDLAESATKQVELVIAGGAPSTGKAVGRGPTPVAEPSNTPAPQADSTSIYPPLTYAALGVGGLGLGVGVVTGIMAASKHSSVEQQCPHDQCLEGSAAEQDLEGFRTLRTVSTVGYVVGALGVAGGVALYLVAPTGGAHQARVTAYLTPSSAGISGRF
jgi:hypothetical protein